MKKIGMVAKNNVVDIIQHLVDTEVRDKAHAEDGQLGKDVYGVNQSSKCG